jgi:hypothetical protein
MASKSETIWHNAAGNSQVFCHALRNASAFTVCHWKLSEKIVEFCIIYPARLLVVFSGSGQGC